jgi:hypothetical protein
MGRAKNAAIAVVLLILAFLVILVIVTAVREYSAAHQKPKDPDTNPDDTNPDDTNPKDTKHKKIPTNYFILGPSSYLFPNNYSEVATDSETTDFFESNKKLYTWVFDDDLDYVSKNQRPVTIIGNSQSGAVKILKSKHDYALMTGDLTSEGLFLIMPVSTTVPEVSKEYYIVGTDNKSTVLEDLYWGIAQQTGSKIMCTNKSEANRFSIIPVNSKK